MLKKGGENTMPDEGREDCKGSGTRINIHYGEDNYKLLADNGKEYIENLLRGALKSLTND